MYFSPYAETQRNCQSFSCVTAFRSYAYCRAAGPVSKMASQLEKAFCVLNSEVSRSLIAVQLKFYAWFKKEIILVWFLFV
jgi:hypothetical protein